MPEARKIPLPIAPGIVLNVTEYEAQGRYIDCDHVRFAEGKAQKIGGWEQWNNDGEGLSGVCRSVLCWQDFNYNIWHAFGTSDRLWVYLHDKVRTNITPFNQTGTLSNPFSTISGSETVTVADVGHGLIVGQYVNFSGASAVGGITVSGEYEVQTVVDADSYTIAHSSAASSSAGPGGGASVAFSYELAAGNINVTSGGGWGIGRYGEGTYGNQRSSATFIQLPRKWSFDTYGQYLLALASGGNLYKWDADPNNRASAVANAPTGQFMFVTSERIVVILGANGDLMTLRWCDDDDETVWTPDEDNTANIRRLQEGSRLMAGARLVKGLNIVWSDTAVYLMQFNGTNSVYSTPILGANGSGLIAPGAFAVVDGIAFWMSQTAFHMYGGQLLEIPRSRDIKAVLDQIDPEQRFKTHCHFNPIHREIWWMYPSVGSNECDRYVAVSLDSWDWIIGTMDRCAFGAVSKLGTFEVLGVDEDGTIYQHETGTDADGLALDWHIETGFMDISSGNQGLNIDGYIPDFARQSGSIELTYTSRDLPEDTSNLEMVSKSIAEEQTVVDLRHFGRQTKLRLEQSGVVGGDFRLGGHRIEVSGTATRRQG